MVQRPVLRPADLDADRLAETPMTCPCGEPAVTDDGLCRVHDQMVRAIISSQALSDVHIPRETAVRVLGEVLRRPTIRLEVPR